MKNVSYITTLVLLAAAGLAAATSAGTTESSAVFERLKSLTGQWEGTNASGNAVTATYRVFSRGSALVEILSPESEDGMITVYHLDEADLRLTHYCSAQNQPRMKAVSASPDGRVVSFEFVDATNLRSLDVGHMQGLELTIIDHDRLMQKWTWVENGRESYEVIRLSRVQ